MHPLDLFTILCLGLLTGNELAVSWFVNPTIWKLNESPQAQALSPAGALTWKGDADLVCAMPGSPDC